MQDFIKSIIIVVLITTLQFNSPLLAGAAEYKDLSGHWAQKNIESLVTYHYINGYPDGTFRPDQPISRAEFITLLLNILHVKPSFSLTVPSTHWAQAQIDQAVDQGIILLHEYPYGYEPDGSLNRGELATMVIRALKKQPDYGPLPFSDAEQIANSAYRGYIKTAYSEGIISGYPDGKFKPYNPVTRAQAATVCLNLIDKLQSTGPIWNPAYSSVSSQKIAGLIHDDHRYDPFYVDVYIDGETSPYFLSDVEVINQYSVKLAGRTFALPSGELRVYLQGDYYLLSRVVNDSQGKPVIEVGSRIKQWEYLNVSDIYAIYDSEGDRLSPNSIDSIQFRIDGDYFDLDQVKIDSEGVFLVKNRRFPADQITIRIRESNDKSYQLKLKEIRFRGDEIILDCNERESNFASHVEINGRRYRVSQVTIYRGNTRYDLDDIEVFSRDRIRIDDTNYNINNYTFKCEYNNRKEVIKGIYYDRDDELIVIRTDNIDSIAVSDLVFIRKGVELTWPPSQVELRINNRWVRLDNRDLYIIDADSFEYDGRTYDFLDTRIRRSNTDEYIIDRTYWNDKRGELEIEIS